eukprot:scaffold7971_cov296-Pinguiococcus_pyrenoidosus.AAC.5
MVFQGSTAGPRLLPRQSGNPDPSPSSGLPPLHILLKVERVCLFCDRGGVEAFCPKLLRNVVEALGVHGEVQVSNPRARSHLDVAVVTRSDFQIVAEASAERLILHISIISAFGRPALDDLEAPPVDVLLARLIALQHLLDGGIGLLRLAAELPRRQGMLRLRVARVGVFNGRRAEAVRTRPQTGLEQAILIDAQILGLRARGLWALERRDAVVERHGSMRKGLREHKAQRHGRRQLPCLLPGLLGAGAKRLLP